MIAEVSANHKTAEMFRQMAQALTGRAEANARAAGCFRRCFQSS